MEYNVTVIILLSSLLIIAVALLVTLRLKLQSHQKTLSSVKKELTVVSKSRFNTFTKYLSCKSAYRALLHKYACTKAELDAENDDLRDEILHLNSLIRGLEAVIEDFSAPSNLLKPVVKDDNTDESAAKVTGDTRNRDILVADDAFVARAQRNVAEFSGRLELWSKEQVRGNA